MTDKRKSRAAKAQPSVAAPWVVADKEIDRLHTEFLAARKLPPLIEGMPAEQRAKSVKRLKEIAALISELVDELVDQQNKASKRERRRA